MCLGRGTGGTLHASSTLSDPCVSDARQTPPPPDRLRPSHLGGSEAAGTLLIHLGARGDSINGHVEEFAGPHQAHQPVNVLEDVLEHLQEREKPGVATDRG